MSFRSGARAAASGGWYRTAIAVVAATLIAPSSGWGQSRALARGFPLHTHIVATVFWIGEPVGDGSTENNAVSAYDDRWQLHYGGPDPVSPARRPPYFPPFRPHENPFYLDLPYDDFHDDGTPRDDRFQIVPWGVSVGQLAAAHQARGPFSLMKNRWVEITHRHDGKARVCYGQIEDAGPYVYDDAAYVFGAADQRPRSRLAHNAGMDVSPALRDCLGFSGLNNDRNTVDWRFVAFGQVPQGPWRQIVTTRQIFWP